MVSTSYGALHGGMDNRLVVVPYNLRYIVAHLESCQGLSALHDDIRVVVEHDMEQQVVIGSVAIVAVAVPVGGAHVNLHLSRPFHAVDKETRIHEIRAGIAVEHSRTQHLYTTSIGGTQVAVKQSMLPEIL